MTTNRQWLSEMNDRTLAEFLTCGIEVRMVNFHTDSFCINIRDIASQYTSSALGIELWLSAPKQYEIVKGGEQE
mgnify:CR=1 FL=1